MKLNLDSPILHFLSQVYDVLYCTVLFVLFSLPVVTIGASFTAAQCTMMHIAADSCSGVWTRFTSSFKENFRLATILWLCAIPVGAVVIMNLNVCFVQGGAPDVLRGLTLFTTGLYVSVFIYAFGGLSRFHVTWKQCLTNAVIWTVRKLHWTLVLLLLTTAMALCIYLAWWYALPAVALGLFLQGRVLNQVFGLQPEKEKDGNPGDEVINYD